MTILFGCNESVTIGLVCYVGPRLIKKVQIGLLLCFGEQSHNSNAAYRKMFKGIMNEKKRKLT